MIITVFRTFIMYMFVVLTLRIMGKRQIGQLEASELVVTIIISDIAAMPITNIGTPMSSSIVAITILLILEVLISYFAYKNINTISAISHEDLLPIYLRLPQAERELKAKTEAKK